VLRCAIPFAQSLETATSTNEITCKLNPSHERASARTNLREPKPSRTNRSHCTECESLFCFVVERRERAAIVAELLFAGELTRIAAAIPLSRKKRPRPAANGVGLRRL
jgi:hypothetical protein